MGGIGGPAGFGNGDPHFTVIDPRIPNGGGGGVLLGNPGLGDMIDRGMQQYQQRYIMLLAEHAVLSSATGAGRNVMPWEMLIPAEHNGVFSAAPEDGGDGGGGNGNTMSPEEFAGKHDEAVGAPSGYFAADERESRNEPFWGQWWNDVKEGANDLWEDSAAKGLWDWYNGLPWWVQMGMDGVGALLEPSLFGESAFAAKWGAVGLGGLLRFGGKYAVKKGLPRTGAGLFNRIARNAGGRNLRNVLGDVAEAGAGLLDDVVKFGRKSRGYSSLPELAWHAIKRKDRRHVSKDAILDVLNHGERVINHEHNNYTYVIKNYYSGKRRSDISIGVNENEQGKAEKIVTVIRHTDWQFDPRIHQYPE